MSKEQTLLSNELENQDSEDDAPEDISHVDARRQVEQKRREEQSSIKHAKNLKKQERKRREQRLLEQKNGKDNLNLDRLPESILDALGTEDTDKKSSFEREEGDGRDIIVKTDKPKYARKKKKRIEAADETYVNDQGDEKTIIAHVLNESKRQYESKSQNGKDFLRSTLYGDRIKRVPSATIRYAKASKYARPNARF